MAEEYEIFPHRLLEDLKYDVEALKKKLTEPENISSELIAEMEDLKATVKELNNTFREALGDIKEEDSTKLLKSLQNRIETVTTQNETIARGMVAISDKLEDFMKKNQSSPFGSPRLQAPPPSLGRMPSPPPFPPKPRREGVFR